jgi:hypothetical protein
VVNELSRPFDLCASPSAGDARRRGTLVNEVSVTPGRLDWGGREIEFGDAWVEEAATREYFLAWFPYYRKTGQTFLCFRLSKGNEAFESAGAPFFALSGRGEGVSECHSRKDIRFFSDVGDADVAALKMSLLSSWQDSREDNIGFTPKPNDITSPRDNQRALP